MVEAVRLPKIARVFWSGEPSLRQWLWLGVTYLLIVLVLLAFGGQVGTPSPSDIGWSD
jgi:hypothetical protein